MGKKMGEMFKRERIYVYLWLIHVEVWQKTKNSVKQLLQFTVSMVSVCLPSDFSRNTYRLTWVSLTLDVGYLSTAASAKHSRCSLPWTRGISLDCVDHNKLWKILQEMGIPDHLTCLLRNLYAGQEVTVRTGHGTTDWFQIGKGVRQRLYIVSLLI